MIGTARAVAIGAAGASLGGGGSSTPYDDAVLADAPVAYWRLAESSGPTATDEQGTYDGTYSGSPTLGATGLTGDGDTAVDFRGNANQDEVNTSLTLAAAAFSVEFWFDPDATDNGIVSQGDARNTAPTFDWTIFGTGTALRFRLSDGSSVTTLDVTYPTLAPHHVVCTWDGTTGADSMKIYIDGSLAGSGAAAFTNMSTTHTVVLAGGNPNAGDFWFDGVLDKVAIYDFELTSTQVSDHYAAA